MSGFGPGWLRESINTAGRKLEQVDAMTHKDTSPEERARSLAIDECVTVVEAKLAAAKVALDECSQGDLRNSFVGSVAALKDALAALRSLKDAKT